MPIPPDPRIWESPRYKTNLPVPHTGQGKETGF